MANVIHLQQYKTVYDYYIANASVTPKLAPMATSFTANSATQSYYSDISASLASGASLITLTNFSVNIDAGNFRVEFDADNVSEANQTFSTDKFSIILDTGTPATSVILCTIDFAEGTIAPIDGTFAITVDANGFFAFNDN